MAYLADRLLCRMKLFNDFKDFTVTAQLVRSPAARYKNPVVGIGIDFLKAVFSLCRHAVFAYVFFAFLQPGQMHLGTFLAYTIDRVPEL
ncbi:hypothetical protein D3C77_682440 [compost metagenome]